MKPYFYKRMIQQRGYVLKLLMCLGLVAYLVYFISVRFHYIATEYLNYNQMSYEEATTTMRILEQAYNEPMSANDLERLDLYKDYFGSRIKVYQALEVADYKAYAEAVLEKDKAETLLFEKNYLEIPPDYFLRTVKENNHHLSLVTTYYQPLMGHSSVGANDALMTTASNAILEASGYWWPEFLKVFNLNYLLLFVPLLFSVGIISQDKKRRELYKSTPYSNQSYLKDLTKVLWLHSFLLQLGLIVAYFIPLCLQFGFGHTSSRALLNFSGSLGSIPIVAWIGVYLLVVALLDLILVALLQLGELLFSSVGAFFFALSFLVAGPFIDSLNIRVLGADWLPFYYVDIARALNGTKSVTHGGDFSLVKLVLSSSLMLVVLFVAIRLTARRKETRGYYV